MSITIPNNLTEYDGFTIMFPIFNVKFASKPRNIIWNFAGLATNWLVLNHANELFKPFSRSHITASIVDEQL